MNRFGRRKFCSMVGSGALKAAIVVSVAGSEVFLLSGCAVTLNDVVNWTNIGAQAISTALSFIASAGIVCAACSLAATAATAAIHAIAAAIQAYQNAPATDKTTTWDKVKTAMQAAITAVGDFFKEANLPQGQLATTILNIASLVLSAITGFLQKFFPTVALAVAKVYKLGPSTDIPIAPKVYHPDDFKKTFNGIVAAGGHPEAVIH